MTGINKCDMCVLASSLTHWLSLHVSLTTHQKEREKEEQKVSENRVTMVRKYQPIGGKYSNPPKDIKSKDAKSSFKDAKSNSKDIKGNSKDTGTSSKDAGSNLRDLRRHEGSNRDKKRDKSPRIDRKSNSRRASKDKNVDLGNVKSRREVSMVTINLSGGTVLGLTPQYKVNLVEQYLTAFPDVIFIQVKLD